MDLFSRLTLPQNLHYAWAKAKRLHLMADGFRDLTEFSQFELDLENRLEGVRQALSSGQYPLKHLRILPRPKKIEDGNPINRQYFHVSLDDQVAWIAVVNVLGPVLDKVMPPWSYGNRIYRPAWYEKGDEPQDKRLEIGPYRHANGQLYRKFQHSWPLFRRVVSLTCKTMSRAEHSDFESEPPDQAEQIAAETARKDGLLYLDPTFWKPTTGKDRRFLHHASIDLTQFFPRIRRASVVKALKAEIGDAEGGPEIISLVKGMLNFKIEDQAIDETIKYGTVEPLFEGFDGIPTGLFVSGFLSNLAMLPADKIMDEKVRSSRKVAHFRFVDDHTIIAYTFKDLCDWIASYEALLGELNIGAEINWEKTDPKKLAEFIVSKRDDSDASTDALVKELEELTQIDGRNPIKLLTKTLTRISALATTGIDTLDDDDLKGRLDQLEWLLLADIPDREIRADTRAAFAAGQISNLAPLLNHMSTKLVTVSRKLAHLKQKEPQEKTSSIIGPLSEMDVVNADFMKHWREFEVNENAELDRCFRLLMQAFREHPTKARLFFRLHQYCRLTGFAGLGVFSKWLQELEDGGQNYIWRDYYAALSLQLIGDGALKAARVLQSQVSMRSEKRAARRYLHDITSPKVRFDIPVSRELWFHRVARQEFQASLHAVSKGYKEQSAEEATIFEALASKANLYGDLNFSDESGIWKAKTGYHSGCWAHSIESRMSAASTPTEAWYALETTFDYQNTHDQLAARYFPRHFSSHGSQCLLFGYFELKKDDAGWVIDWLSSTKSGRPERAAANKNAPKVVTSAAKSIMRQRPGEINLYDWVKFTFNKQCDPFDPRRGEWTSLEIVRQLIERLNELEVVQTDADDLFSMSAKDDVLRGFHPANIWVPQDWVDRGLETWDDWKKACSGTDHATLSELENLIEDYRYASSENLTDQFFRSVGRVLLGLLTGSFDGPPSWNLRGNEQTGGFPKADELQRLAASSRTILIIDACLNKRSDENRLILKQTGLFGLEPGDSAKDTEFDAPILVNPSDLVDEIRIAQRELELNQLSITYQQPRQLIPFRIRDFSAVTRGNDEGQADDS
jgi:hypothetical protein